VNFKRDAVFLPNEQLKSCGFNCLSKRFVKRRIP